MSILPTSLFVPSTTTASATSSISTNVADANEAQDSTQAASYGPPYLLNISQSATNALNAQDSSGTTTASDSSSASSGTQPAGQSVHHHGGGHHHHGGGVDTETTASTTDSTDSTTASSSDSILQQLLQGIKPGNSTSSTS